MEALRARRAVISLLLQAVAGDTTKSGGRRFCPTCRVPPARGHASARGQEYAIHPPSIVMGVPVISLAASLQRNTTSCPIFLVGMKRREGCR